jgi:hypothetical protein
MAPIWVVLEIKENLYKGPQFNFFPFYRKVLIRVWYCNLRNPVKATSLGHLRDTEAKPQYKASNIFFQCFNRQASRDHLGTKARRLERAGPIQKDNIKEFCMLGHEHGGCSLFFFFFFFGKCLCLHWCLAADLKLLWTEGADKLVVRVT